MPKGPQGQKRRALYLLLLGPLVIDSAIAQPSGPSTAYVTRVKLVQDYGAHKYKDVIAEAAALQKLHAMDPDAARVTAQAYFLSGDKPGCAKYIQNNFSDPAANPRIAPLLKRCQTQP